MQVYESTSCLHLSWENILCFALSGISFYKHQHAARSQGCTRVQCVAERAHPSRRVARTESCAHYRHSGRNNNRSGPRRRRDLMDLNRGWNPSFICESEHGFACGLVTDCVRLCARRANYNKTGGESARARERTHTRRTGGCVGIELCAVPRLVSSVRSRRSHVKTPWPEFSSHPSAIFSPSRPPSILVSSCTCLPSTSFAAIYSKPDETRHTSHFSRQIALRDKSKKGKQMSERFFFLSVSLERLRNDRRCLGDTLRADDLGPSWFHVILFFFFFFLFAHARQPAHCSASPAPQRVFTRSGSTASEGGGPYVSLNPLNNLTQQPFL